MIFSFLLPVVFVAAAAAQTNSIVCDAGQCLLGVINTTLGVTLSIPSNPSILLLPGVYTASTGPQLLTDALSSQQASLSFPSGFSTSSSASSTLALPLTVALQPGILSYPQPLYHGQSTFTSGSNLATTTFSSGSFLLPPNTWAAFTSPNSRFTVWDPVPDLAQLPFSNTGGSLSLVAIQSAACSPPCASPGSCSTSGRCICPPNFAGQSCENCASGFFGPSCHPCPPGCTTCDDGLTGSGICLVSSTVNLPSSCNCVNGVCSGNVCTCNAGWTANSNGTACASCAQGFYLNSNGDCSACHSSCAQCSDGTGTCNSCKFGLTPDSSQPQACSPLNNTITTSNGTLQQCVGPTFASSNQCVPCSEICLTCLGPNPTPCLVCASGLVMNGGQCVGVEPNGVCFQTTLIADGGSHACTGCPAKCTACSYGQFNHTSFSGSQLQCTACIPGSALYQGQCVSQCPSGTFQSSDTLTCSPCDSTCPTCVGNAKFCRSCGSNQLVFNGTCTSTCPPNTFLSGSACLPCHPDCATCSGTAFNQCQTCPPSRPALSSGQCLPTCIRSQFLDATSSCKNCDATCASCTGTSPDACLACAKADQVLKSGACVPSSCTSSTSIVPGLGVCLSDLVTVSNSSSATLPTFLPSGASSSPGPRVASWQILLIMLGCIVILILAFWLWSRFVRKLRAQNHAWRHRFDERLEVNPQTPDVFDDEIEVQRLRRLEAVRHVASMRKIENNHVNRVPSPQLNIDGVNNVYSDSFNGAEQHGRDNMPIPLNNTHIPGGSTPIPRINTSRRSGDLLRFSTMSSPSSYSSPENSDPISVNPMGYSQPQIPMYIGGKKNLGFL